jgi:DNA-binding transcriptional MerR regulator
MSEQRILLEAPKLALTRVKAADALSVSPATLDRLAVRGLIHPSRATRRPLYSKSEIERFLRDTTKGISTESILDGTKDRNSKNGPKKGDKNAS